MARLLSRFASATALISAFSMAAAPASAAPLPAAQGGLPSPVAAQGWDVRHETANNYRDYRRWGRHRGGGIDTGDVIAGVLILGGIAAIASAASNSKRQRETERYPDYPDRDYRAEDYPSRDRPYDYRGDRDDRGGYSDGRGMDRAADMCVREVERREQVDDVDNVARTADGWRVGGTLRNGREFSCEIGNDGRIGDVRLDRSIAGAGSDDRQWRDGDYARAREQGSARNGDDGRYRTADVPDFDGGV
ncbi:MAG: hypothetical protein WCY92_06760 [Novosphingobium sp.]